MSAQQPEALRLAAWLNEGAWRTMRLGDVEAAGRELRRLHAINAELLEALRAARACIMTDRTCLSDCHMDPVTNTVDVLGQAGLDEYDAMLKQIDTAIAKATGQEGGAL